MFRASDYIVFIGAATHDEILETKYDYESLKTDLIEKNKLNFSSNKYSTWIWKENAEVYVHLFLKTPCLSYTFFTYFIPFYGNQRVAVWTPQIINKIILLYFYILES